MKMRSNKFSRRLVAFLVCMIFLLGVSVTNVKASEYLTLSNVFVSAERFNPKATTLKINYTASEPCLVYCVIYDSNNGVVKKVATGAPISEAGSYYASWNGGNDNNKYVAAGKYTIGVLLMDEDGNKSETLFTKVEVYYSSNSTTNTSVSAPVISKLSLGASSFNPRTNQLKISFTTDKACQAYIKIYDANDYEVATVTNGGKLSKASNWYYMWKGTDSNGNYIAPGNYTAKVYVGNASGNSQTLAANFSISNEATSNNSTSGTAISIPDKVLEKCIRSKLNKWSGALTASDMLNVKSLDVSQGVTDNNNNYYWGISNLTGLEYCKNLTSFKCIGCDKAWLTGVNSLKGLKNLTSLDLSFNKISNIDALSGLTNLRTLKIGGNQISSVSALKNLTRLEVLYLGNESGLSNYNFGNKISDISPLVGLTNLKVLVTYDNDNVRDISALSGMTNLTYLSIRGAKINNISPLRNMRNLTYLDFGGSSTTVRDISVLSGLTQLKTLMIAGNKIVSIEPLRNLTNLEQLSIAGNSVVNITPISGLYNLKKLALGTQCAGGNPIKDLTPVKELTGLTELEMHSVGLKNLYLVSNLTGLEFLDIRGNDLKDISALSSLTSLKTLYYKYGNNITDISPIQGFGHEVKYDDFY